MDSPPGRAVCNHTSVFLRFPIILLFVSFFYTFRQKIDAGDRWRQRRAVRWTNNCFVRGGGGGGTDDLSAGRLDVKTTLFPFKGEKFSHMKRNQVHLIHCVSHSAVLMLVHDCLTWTCSSRTCRTSRTCCCMCWSVGSCHGLRTPRAHAAFNTICTHALTAQRQGSKHIRRAVSSLSWGLKHF